MESFHKSYHISTANPRFPRSRVFQGRLRTHAIFLDIVSQKTFFSIMGLARTYVNPVVPAYAARKPVPRSSVWQLGICRGYYLHADAGRKNRFGSAYYKRLNRLTARSQRFVDSLRAE